MSDRIQLTRVRRGVQVALVILGLAMLAPASSEAAVRFVLGEYFTNIY